MIRETAAMVSATFFSTMSKRRTNPRSWPRLPLVLIPALCSVTLFALTVESARAAEHFATQVSDWVDVAKRIQAGDTLVLADGTWKDIDLKLERLPGRGDAPIEIRAQTPGKVTFTGKSVFRFSGNHVNVSGFRFRDIQGISDVVQFRTHSERHAHHSRVSHCLFEESEDFQCKNESRWVSIYGTNNRVDHCEFVGKKNRGTTLVVWVRPENEHHQIDHNFFGLRPVLGRNGGETIRIGTSETSQWDSRCVVTDNYFFRCSGEAEIISNKSCGNVYQFNRFVECGGALTLRHGHRCVVNGNRFMGNQHPGTGGVRIIGSDHQVTNNYMEGLRGDAARAAISMMNAIPDSPLSGYAAVRNSLVANNTMVDCKVSLEIGVGAGKKQSVVPRDCRWSHNLFVPGKWDVARMHVDVESFSWVENRLIKATGEGLDNLDTVSEPIKLARDQTGMLRPMDRRSIVANSALNVDSDIDGEPREGAPLVGCDHLSSVRRSWPDPDSLRPAWRTND